MMSLMSSGDGLCAKLHSHQLVSFIYPDESYDHCILSGLNGTDRSHDPRTFCYVVFNFIVIIGWLVV